jgi:hypothetical protein
MDEYLYEVYQGLCYSRQGYLKDYELRLLTSHDEFRVCCKVGVIC